MKESGVPSIATRFERRVPRTCRVLRVLNYVCWNIRRVDAWNVGVATSLVISYVPDFGHASRRDRGIFDPMVGLRLNPFVLVSWQCTEIHMSLAFSTALTIFYGSCLFLAVYSGHKVYTPKFG
jgi:hypothetical protein